MKQKQKIAITLGVITFLIFYYHFYNQKIENKIMDRIRGVWVPIERDVNTEFNMPFLFLDSVSNNRLISYNFEEGSFK